MSWTCNWLAKEQGISQCIVQLLEALEAHPLASENIHNSTHQLPNTRDR